MKNVLLLAATPVPMVGMATPTVATFDRQQSRILTIADVLATYPLLSFRNWGTDPAWPSLAEATAQAAAVEEHMSKSAQFDPLIAIASRFNKSPGPSFRGLFFDAIQRDDDAKEAFEETAKTLRPMLKTLGMAWLAVMRPLLSHGPIGAVAFPIMRAMLKHTVNNPNAVMNVMGPWPILTTPAVAATIIVGDPTKTREVVQKTAAAYASLRTLAEAFKNGRVETTVDAHRVCAAIATITGIPEGTDVSDAFFEANPPCVCGKKGDQEALRHFIINPGTPYVTSCTSHLHVTGGILAVTDKTLHGDATHYTLKDNTALGALWKGICASFEASTRNTMPATYADQPRGIIIPSFIRTLTALVGDAWKRACASLAAVHDLCMHWMFRFDASDVSVASVSATIAALNTGAMAPADALNRIARMVRAVWMEVADEPTGLMVFGNAQDPAAPGSTPYVPVDLKSPSEAAVKLPGAPRPGGKRRRLVVPNPAEAETGEDADVAPAPSSAPTVHPDPLPPLAMLKEEITARVSPAHKETWGAIHDAAVKQVNTGEDPADRRGFPDMLDPKAFIRDLNIELRSESVPKAVMYGHAALGDLTNDAGATYRFSTIAAMVTSVIAAPASMAGALLYAPGKVWNPHPFSGPAPDDPPTVGRGPGAPCAFDAFKPQKTLMEAFMAQGEVAFTHAIPNDVVMKDSVMTAAHPKVLAAMTCDSIFCSAMEQQLGVYLNLAIDDTFGLPTPNRTTIVFEILIRRHPRRVADAAVHAAREQLLPPDTTDAFLRTVTAPHFATVAGLLCYLFQLNRCDEFVRSSPAIHWMPTIGETYPKDWESFRGGKALADLFTRTRYLACRMYEQPDVVPWFVEGTTRPDPARMLELANLRSKCTPVDWDDGARPLNLTKEAVSPTRYAKPSVMNSLSIACIEDTRGFMVNGKYWFGLVDARCPLSTPRPMTGKFIRQPADAIRRGKTTDLSELGRITTRNMVVHITTCWQPVFLTREGINKARATTTHMRSLRWLVMHVMTRDYSHCIDAYTLYTSRNTDGKRPMSKIARRNHLGNLVIREIITWIVKAVCKALGKTEIPKDPKHTPRILKLMETRHGALDAKQRIMVATYRAAANIDHDEWKWNRHHAGAFKTHGVQHGHGYFPRVCEAADNDELRVFFIPVPREFSPETEALVKATQDAERQRLIDAFEAGYSESDEDDYDDEAFTYDADVDPARPRTDPDIPVDLEDADVGTVPIDVDATLGTLGHTRLGSDSEDDDDDDFVVEGDGDAMPGDSDLPGRSTGQELRDAMTGNASVDILRTSVMIRGMAGYAKGPPTQPARAKGKPPTGAATTATPFSVAPGDAAVIDLVAARGTGENNMTPLGIQSTLKTIDSMKPSQEEFKNPFYSFSPNDTRYLRKNLPDAIQAIAYQGTGRVHAQAPPKPTTTAGADLWRAGITEAGYCCTVDPNPKGDDEYVEAKISGTCVRRYPLMDAVLMAAGHPSARVPIAATATARTKKVYIEFNATADQHDRPTQCSRGVENCVNWRHYTPFRMKTAPCLYGLNKDITTMCKGRGEFAEQAAPFFAAMRNTAAYSPRTVAAEMVRMKTALGKKGKEDNAAIAAIIAKWAQHEVRRAIITEQLEYMKKAVTWVRGDPKTGRPLPPTDTQ